MKEDIRTKLESLSYDFASSFQDNIQLSELREAKAGLEERNRALLEVQASLKAQLEERDTESTGLKDKLFTIEKSMSKVTKEAKNEVSKDAIKLAT